MYSWPSPAQPSRQSPIATAFIMLPILAGVPQAQEVDSGVHYLVTHLVMADLNSPHIPWLELFQAFANARFGQQRDRCGRELLHCSCGGRLTH